MLKKRIISGIMGLMLTVSISTSINAEQQYKRIDGTDRYRTSLETLKFMNSDKIVIADGEQFADSLSAVNLCNALNAKLLLVNNREDIDRLLSDNEYKSVYIVGGEKSISYDFERKLKSRFSEVKRVSGVDRYDTNKKTLAEAGFKNVGLASGKSYADALSSTKFIKDNNLGLLLYNPDNTNNDFSAYNIEFVFGGKKAVPLNLGERIAGKNRYETSVEISKRTDAENSVIVSGGNFADALSSVNIVDGKNATVYIAPEYGQITDGQSPLKDGTIYVVGGKKVLSDANVKYLITGVESSEFRKETEKKKAKETEEYKKSEIAKKGYYEIKANPSEITDVDANMPKLENYEIIKENGKNYLYKIENGEIVKFKDTKNGFAYVEGRTYLLNSDNSLTEGLFNKEGKTYLQSLENGLKRGWQSINGYLYYFSPMNFNMYKGHAKSTGLNVYWFGDNGRVREGDKPSGIRKRPIRFYGPTKEDLTNSWILRPDAKQRFRGQEAVNFAAEHEGLPFRWFGCDLRDKRGVYCCGSAYSALKEYGIKIPGPEDSDYKKDEGYRMVKDQYLGVKKYGGKYIKMDYNKLLPGDELFTRSKKRPYHHAMLYMGKNNGTPYIVHATLNDGYLVGSAHDIPTWKHEYLNAVRWLN